MNRATRLVALLGVVLWVAGAAPAAQQVGGVPREPVVSHPHDLEASYIRMPLPPGEEKYGRIDGARMKEFLRDIVAVSAASKADGDLLWGRIAGTKYDDLVEGVVERRFKEFGLQEVRRQYFDLPPQWFPTAWEFSATSGGKTLKLETARAATRSAASPAGGLDLEPVWVGLGTASDFAGRDVRGKLVLIQSIAMPGVVAHSAEYNDATERAAEQGAAAVAFNVAIPGNFQVQIGPGNTRVPTFTIGTEDMTALREAMERGAVKVRVRLATEMRQGLRDASVWGVLPGTTTEDIVIMAHHDAYFYGSLDNASGMSVMLGLAEYSRRSPPASGAGPCGSSPRPAIMPARSARPGFITIAGPPSQTRSSPSTASTSHRRRRTTTAMLLCCGSRTVSMPAGGGSTAAAASHRSRRAPGRSSA